MSQPLRVAAFELIISGRFWVIAKELVDCVSPEQPQGQDAGIFLVLSNGRRISITTGFDAATLVRLVTLLDEV